VAVKRAGETGFPVNASPVRRQHLISLEFLMLLIDSIISKEDLKGEGKWGQFLEMRN
jgi:hypothetical protein